jgi:hypothetical protein
MKQRIWKEAAVAYFNIYLEGLRESMKTERTATPVDRICILNLPNLRQKSELMQCNIWYLDMMDSSLYICDIFILPHHTAPSEF